MTDLSTRATAPYEGLSLVGTRPKLSDYLVDAWTRRAFAGTLAQYRLVGGLLNNRLGVLWIVLKPLTTALIYGTIFGLILAGSARPADWVPYLIVGVFTFEYFTGCFGGGARSITGNTRLVQSLSFPRILLPLSVVLEQSLRAIPIMALLGVLLVLFGVPITWSWLLALPILVMMGLFNFGVALVVARMSVTVRDVQQIIPIVNRVLFYASSIFFKVDVVFADHPVLLTIAHLVPTYDFIALMRDVLLVSHPAPLLAIIAAPAWTLLALSIGVVYFWRAEARYGLSD